jgi:ATP-dependent DNA ligase
MSFAAKAIGANILLKMEVSRVPFIGPALPKLRTSPPTGEGWLYELKFDGYRVQLHKAATVGMVETLPAAFKRWPRLSSGSQQSPA